MIIEVFTPIYETIVFLLGDSENLEENALFLTS